MDPLTRLGHRTWMLANSDSITARADADTCPHTPAALLPGEQPLVLRESLEPENASHPER